MYFMNYLIIFSGTFDIINICVTTRILFYIIDEQYRKRLEILSFLFYKNN